MWDKSRISDSHLQELISFCNPELAFAIFQAISDCDGPSQTATYSRGRVIQHWWQRLTGNSEHFTLDLLGSGNPCITLGETPRLVMISHCDEISYLVGGNISGHSGTTLVPFCNHQSEIWWPARALRFNSDLDGLEVVAKGEIRPAGLGANGVGFWGSEKLQPGDRVVYDNPAVRQGNDRLFGKVDNAFGVTVLILVASFLKRMGLVPPIWLLFTDEEEGPPGTVTSFSRGMRRLLNQYNFPAETVFIEVDGHELEATQTPRPFATYAEQASDCKGAVTPPHLFQPFASFASYLKTRGLKVEHHKGYVCRGDSAALIEFRRNTLLAGYEVQNTHYQNGRPTASLGALTHLAEFLICLALGADHG